MPPRTIQYENFVKFLSTGSYKMIPTVKEYYANITGPKKLKTVIFSCKNNHTCTFTQDSFINKMNNVKKNKITMKYLCDKCKKSDENKEKDDEFKTSIDDIKKQILENCGHKILTITDKKNISYECGNCERNIEHTTLNNLEKSTGYCVHCQNDKNKLSENEIRERLKNCGFKYVENSYKNNKDLKVICPKCNNIINESLYHFERGRKCPNKVCFVNEREKTCMEKYGVTNPAKLDVIKERIVETNLERYGKEHAMQLKSYQEKVQKTMQEKYGIKFAFHSDESFEKIRKTCMERYGKEFPLQCSFIQAKIKKYFMETIGVEYPMMNQEHWKNKLLDMYGVDHYSRCPEYIIKFRKTCMDKYGVDSYSKTPEFLIQYKKTCMDKYGVEFPMQNSIIFEKYKNSCYKRKKYVFPSGRIEYIQGYENICINKLLEIYNENDIVINNIFIPIIKYTKSKIDKNNNKYESKNHYYYPDIWIPSLNLLIEVKSTWTYNLDKENNDRKMQACVNSGYNIDLWIYDHKKNIDKRSYKLNN